MLAAISSRTPAFAHPAGQAISSSQLANTADKLANSLGQLIDANGNVILDSNGNPVMKPTAATPPVVVQTPLPPYDFGGLLINVLISAVVVGGAAFVGSYYGSERAARRASRRASRV